MDEENKKRFIDDDDLVARYVLGQVTPEEKEQLEAELAENEEAQARVRDEREIASGIRRHGRNLMKAQLRTRLRRSQGAQFTSFHYIGFAAAVLFLAIGIGAYQLWLSDLIAPKSFGQQEVILTPQESEPEEQVTADVATDGEQGSQGGNAEPQKSSAAQEQSASEQERTIAARKETSESVAETETKSSVQEPPVPSAALSDVQPDAAPAAVSAEAGRQSIWLIGKVVMIADRSVAAMSKLGSRPSAADNKRETIALQSAPAQQRAKDAGIHLQQKAINDLPAGFAQRKDAREQSVQTLLERSDAGLSLTLYGDAVKDEDLQQAVVETFTEDSLVVSLPHQRIAFRLPAGWGAQQLRR